jgi:hypothetical protein
MAKYKKPEPTAEEIRQSVLEFTPLKYDAWLKCLNHEWVVEPGPEPKTDDGATARAIEEGLESSKISFAQWLEDRGFARDEKKYERAT